MKFKSVVFGLIAALAFVSMGIPTSIYAQATLLRMTVPFDFYFGAQKFPAGIYTVGRVGLSDAIRISDEQGRAAVAVSNATDTPRKDLAKSQVVFNRYGNTYFLSEVKWTDYPTARALPITAMEAELAKSSPRDR